MGKEKAPRRVGEKEALSVGTTIRGSAQKLNLVAGLIRGKKAEEAMNILAFSKRAMAQDARKVLASAIANAEHNHQIRNLDDLRVVRATADGGPSAKRVSPRAMGRAYFIKHRTSHLTIELSDETAPVRSAGKR